MIRKTSVILALAAGLVLSLATSVTIADQNCKSVNAKVTKVYPVLVDPAADPEGVCSGYQLCQFIEIVGTINGEWKAFWNFDEEVYLAEFDALVFDTEDIFKTKKGDIFAKDIGALNFEAEESFTVHIAVTGGTGIYEGATGWMTGSIVFVFAEGGGLTGKICGPNL